MHIAKSDGVVLLSVSWLAMIAAGCGKVAGSNSVPVDAIADAPVIDDAAADGAPVDGAPPGSPGSKDNPAHTCAELNLAKIPSGVYWLSDPAGLSPPFQVYCEQQLNGGGWAMLENSVRRDDGTTTTFWQFKYADRLKQMGTLAVDQNYYNGSLYLIGKDYMDVFVDLQGKTVVAAVMTAAAFNATTMRFSMPSLTVGNAQVFNGQFASGWSSQDHDDDEGATANCAVLYGNVAQHYNDCWAYSLGSDADTPVLDGGVGPHVINVVLTALGLSLQPNGGTYSQVKRIARFTRW
jgi:hypothetical protein